MNRYPLWKNILLVVALLVGLIYALPNYFGEAPSVQVSSIYPGLMLDSPDFKNISTAVESLNTPYQKIYFSQDKKNIIILFSNNDQQLNGKELLVKALPKQYTTTLNLQEMTPKWLAFFAAHPMKLGLDLRGGVHFLLQVDVDSVLKTHEKNYIHAISDELRKAKIRYTKMEVKESEGIFISFDKPDVAKKGIKILQVDFPELIWSSNISGNTTNITGKLSSQTTQTIEQNVIEQTISVMRHRVNELGVSEAIVQQEGMNRVSIDLPGIQDAVAAKNILGKTATIKFQMVDESQEAQNAASNGMPLVGDDMYQFGGRTVLLKDRIVLSGDSITNAIATSDPTTSRPIVSLRVGGAGVSLFEKITSENVGNQMATVYTEVTPEKTKDKDGKDKIIYNQNSRIINIATIDSPLSTDFQISGLSRGEAINLSILLRAGSLPTSIAPIEERTIGASMGEKNIHMGLMSVLVGLLLVALFMILYYRVFGLIANIGLCINLIFLLALLGLLGATLTFSGIAGIVLTVGMSVDANVLIYERIREELRQGLSTQAAIFAGYKRALVTIVDANVTTLIVALLLFTLGTGAVKGFAIVLILGLITSMFTAIIYTRAMVNFVYGGRKIKHLSIGIKVKGK